MTRSAPSCDGEWGWKTFLESCLFYFLYELDKYPSFLIISVFIFVKIWTVIGWMLITMTCMNDLNIWMHIYNIEKISSLANIIQCIYIYILYVLYCLMDQIISSLPLSSNNGYNIYEFEVENNYLIFLSKLIISFKWYQICINFAHQILQRDG